MLLPKSLTQTLSQKLSPKTLIKLSPKTLATLSSKKFCLKEFLAEILGETFG